MSHVTLRPELGVALGMMALTGVNVGLADAPDVAAASRPASVAPNPSPHGTNTARFSTASGAATRVGAHRVFLGNLHSHTSYSDGSGTPLEAYTHARNEGHLDFLAITEHNHDRAEDGAPADRKDGVLIALNPALYSGNQPESLVSAANTSTQNGQFLALFGQEVSTISSGNHTNVFDVPDVIRVPNGDYRALLTEWLPAHPDTSGAPPLMQLNHPEGTPNEYGQDDFPTRAAWVAALDPFAELIEVFNGPGTKNGSDFEPTKFSKNYLEFLDMGLHLGPTGNQDNHYLTWGTLTSTRTGVIAKSLSKPDMMAALRARHVFASMDPNLRFVAQVDVAGTSHLMGDLIPPPPANSEVTISFELRDDDEPDASYRIDVYSDLPGDDELATIIDTRHFGSDASGAGAIDGLPFVGVGQYILLKVTQSSEDEANDQLWTAPVWFQQPDAAPPTEPEDNDAVASSHSSIYHPDPSCHFARSISAANRVTGEEARRGRTEHEGCPR